MQRRPGKVSFDNDTVRISYDSGQSSVLFEDISSISYEKIDTNIPNWPITLLGIVGIIAGLSSGNAAVLVISLIIAVYGYFKFDHWDDIVIETRGGKQITFSVEKNAGQNTVNQIEKRKRDMK